VIFKKINTDNYDLQKVQDSVAAAFQTLGVNFVVNGELVKGITLQSGVDNKVEHKLGRVPNGFFIADKNANADVWQSTTVNNIKDRLLLLRSSATVTINLWVF
jgi:hypothetical protein